ncbi:hypothetical protein GGTG_04897 [Gaeumannomyces tritici R3-111a-1]|uniref:Uncharacterized protein n=1 Tax=Gaeumannomyces tritici (strain R3-111a-1) TaxID=644352 RepID=J3NUE1_GAET3|nr:hypothetical protein GGTG_04897 [Gaeumannomyces tritici R3-111a-1]EJT79814.1 hypothetical protein GGTG_04897 [Gaeumannomyces tritici R3-111a-1]
MAPPSSSSSSSAQRPSATSGQKRSKRDLALGGGSTFRVWYCSISTDGKPRTHPQCRCGDGPLNTKLISHCPVCFIKRCSECQTCDQDKHD